jgi:hypothetical protein
VIQGNLIKESKVGDGAKEAGGQAKKRWRKV